MKLCAGSAAKHLATSGDTKGLSYTLIQVQLLAHRDVLSCALRVCMERLASTTFSDKIEMSADMETSLATCQWSCSNMHQYANESLKMAELQKPTSLQRSHREMHRDSISGSAEVHALTPHLASHPACSLPYRRTAEIEFAGCQ